MARMTVFGLTAAKKAIAVVLGLATLALGACAAAPDLTPDAPEWFRLRAEVSTRAGYPSLCIAPAPLRNGLNDAEWAAFKNGLIAEGEAVRSRSAAAGDGVDDPIAWMEAQRARITRD